MLKPGDAAPAFSLPASNGKNVSLKDLRGKKVVLYFYPRDSTPGCTIEACSFNENLTAIRRKGVEVIGISADSLASHKKFVEQYGLSFLLLSDESKDVIKAYGVWKQKAFMGRKFMGIVRTTFIIDEKGIISNIFRDVKVKGHTEEVLKSL